MDTKNQILQKWQKAKAIRFKNGDGKIKQIQKCKRIRRTHKHKQEKKATETKIEQAKKQISTKMKQ